MRYRARNRVCAMPNCDEVIEARFTYCSPCKRLRRLREKWARRAAKTTQQWKVREAQRQTVRLCEMAEEAR